MFVNSVRIERLERHQKLNWRGCKDIAQLNAILQEFDSPNFSVHCHRWVTCVTVKKCAQMHTQTPLALCRSVLRSATKEKMTRHEYNCN